MEHLNQVKNEILNLPKGAIYFEEAEFGYRSLRRDLEQLPVGSEVLEVGSGPCLLLFELTQRYPHLKMEGIEPMGNGFHFFSQYHELILKKSTALQVSWVGFEELKAKKKWDYIYLVNVFEHLPCWENFFLFLNNHLKPDGRCVILCPNYSFPYETHFSIPIVFNKSMTYFLFKKKIHYFESIYDCRGLWQSLNFVKYRQVQKKAQLLGFDLKLTLKVLEDILNRMDSDQKFQERHRWMIRIIKTVRKFISPLAIFKIPFVSWMIPYMHLEIRFKQKSH